MSLLNEGIKSFSKAIAYYWNTNNLKCFVNLDERLKVCAEGARKEKNQAIIKLSKAIQTGNLTSVLNQSQTDFRRRVIQLQNIQEDLGDAYEIDSKAYMTSIEAKNVFSENYDQFSKRLGGLTTQINQIYETSLYPFLIVLQNAEKGWDPDGIVCRAWYYYPAKPPANPQAIIDAQLKNWKSASKIQKFNN